MTLGIFLDLVVAGLLATAIGYCVILNRKLAALRADKAQLEVTVRSLTEVSQRAEGGIAKLREMADQVGRSLLHKIEAGQGLCDDLTYMVDRGAGLADRLEGAIRARRDEGKPRTDRADQKPAAAEPEGGVGAMQERLRELLRRADPAGPAVRLSDRPAKKAAAAPAEDPKAPVAGFPSRAERELRRAVEGRRR
jgi:hypothetical protein